MRHCNSRPPRPLLVATSAFAAICAVAAPCRAQEPPALKEPPVAVSDDTLRMPDGTEVHFYRVNSTDPNVLIQELNRWKDSTGATVEAIGPQTVVGLPGSKATVAIQTILRIQVHRDQWPTVLRILEMLDLPEPQVSVEVKIVEVTYDDDLRVGVGPSNVRVDRPAGDVFFKRFDTVFDNVLGGSDSSKVTLGSDDKFVKFDYILQLGKSGATTQVTSKPSIVASQGELARINVGEEEPFVVQQLQGTTVTATTQFRQTGLTLEVRPLRIGRNVVRASIQPKLSRVSSFRVTSTSSDRDVINPVITNREAETVLDVVDGDTVVISGLNQVLDFQQRKGIPLLMDIPVAGYLFGSTTSRQAKTELLFFVTLRIVRPGENRLIVPPGEAERTQ